MNSMTPIPPVASKEEILATKDHVLETFYPISPTIDLQEVNVYQELNDTGKSSFLAVLAFLPRGSGEGEGGNGAVGVQWGQWGHSTPVVVLWRKKRADCFNRS